MEFLEEIPGEVFGGIPGEKPGRITISSWVISPKKFLKFTNEVLEEILGGISGGNSRLLEIP